MVPHGVSWLDAASYAPVLAGGRSALAWELLRRDPNYWQAAARLGRFSEQPAPAAFVARWGLHFR